MSDTTNWFTRDDVKQWRDELLACYKRHNLTAIGIRPDIESLSKDDIIAAVRAGHEGREPKAASSEESPAIELTRIALVEAFDRLVDRKPVPHITVEDLLRNCESHRTAAYRAFRSVPRAVHCHWIRRELDQLCVKTTAQLRDDLERQLPHTAILGHWSDVLVQFIMDRPESRLAMISYMVAGMDQEGARCFATLPQPGDDGYRGKRAQLDEFIELGAMIHRAGARVIYQLSAVFERDKHVFHQPDGAAWQIWKPWLSEEAGQQQVSWKLAMSFWQTLMTNVLSVGLLEAHREGDRLRQFTVDVWCRGATRARG